MEESWESLTLLPWDFEGHIRWDLHQLEVQEFCSEVKKKGQHDFRVRKGKFGPLDHLFAVLGDPSIATCLGSSGVRRRNSPRQVPSEGWKVAQCVAEG